METAEQLRNSEETQESPFELHRIHHVEFYVGNAKQAAYYYRRGFGFKWVGYQGPETGVRDRVSYLLQQGKVRFVLTTPLNPESDIAQHILKHGDGVRDIAFEVDDAEIAHRVTLERGAESVVEPYTTSDDDGSVKRSTIKTYGDTVHSFIESGDFKGFFLPNFRAIEDDTLGEPVGLKYIDHIVGNVDWNQMEDTVNFYKEIFGFRRFVSFDDNDISTEHSALRSTVVANDNLWIKFPINEPAEGMRKSQIEEYVQFYKGPGVQHVAMECEDIIETIDKLRKNGIDFIHVPDAYYDGLVERVGAIQEDVDELRRLNILVDVDDKGYMLQIFTKPVEDRPTLFFEFIQRRGGESFGKGNFKALFEAIERDQDARGNL